ncbi:oligosaccharide flippase family protein [Enterocloster lavalensis]|uniref:oligosaccharide flippase family protein n=1 Tax=Enterocloster lavalensis TaxID=460384 RepID=UPI00140A05F2|nr:lipopolysaccharide biosynthesis protein [Enterocloster lavalensis]
MNRNKELAKNAAYLTIGKISTQFISFLLLPLYTSVLTMAEYGTVDLINTYQQLLIAVLFFQIEQGIFRFIVEIRADNDTERQGGIISSGLVISLFSAFIFTIGFVFLNNLVDSDYVIFLFTNVLAVSFSGFVLQAARGFGDNISYVLGSFLSAVTTIIFNVILVGVMRIGPGGMLSSIFLGNVVCIIVLTIRCKLYRFIRIKNISPKIIKGLLAYSLPLVPNSIAWWVISASDRTVVLYFLGASFNGLLAVSHKFSTVFSSVFQIFNLSWTESASLHINDTDRSAFFSDIINKAMIFFGCICVGIIACMPFVFSMLVNASYSKAYYQIPLFMIGAFLNAVQGLYSVIYIGLKLTKKVAISTVAAAIINVLFGVGLVNHIGLFAAPVSTIISYFIIIIYRYADLRKYVPIKLNWTKLKIFLMMMIVTLLSYYLGNVAVKALMLLAVAVLSYILNKEMINSIIGVALKKIKRKLRRGR